MNFDFVIKINDEAIAGFSDPDTAYCYCLSLLENLLLSKENIFEIDGGYLFFYV